MERNIIKNQFYDKEHAKNIKKKQEVFLLSKSLPKYPSS